MLDDRGPPADEAHLQAPAAPWKGAAHSFSAARLADG